MNGLFQPEILIGGLRLPQTNSSKFLRVIIDHNRVSRSNGVPKKLSEFLTKNIQRNLKLNFVNPHLEYAVDLGSSSSRTLLNTLRRLKDV